MNPLRALFPGCCVLCRRLSGRDIDLCAECEAAFETNDQACPVCAERLPRHVATTAQGSCGACLVSPPPWIKTVAPFAFSPPITSVVEGLKSGNGRLQARILGTLLATAVADRYAEEALPEAVVPMPLTRRRMRARGFNQAALLAGTTGRALGLPRLGRALARIRDAPPQRTLARAARLTNVRGAFVTPRPLAVRRVALVDDVTTTGATVRAATVALRQGGAEEVHVWVAAKTPTDRVV